MTDARTLVAIRGHIEDILHEEGLYFEEVPGLSKQSVRLIVPSPQLTGHVLAIDVGDGGFSATVIEEHKPVAFETQPIGGGVIIHNGASDATISLVLRALLTTWAEDDRL